MEKKGDGDVCFVLRCCASHTLLTKRALRNAWLNTAPHGSLCPESTTALWLLLYQTAQSYPSAGLILGTALHCLAGTAPALVLGQPPQVYTKSMVIYKCTQALNQCDIFYPKRRREKEDLLCLIFGSCVPYLSFLFCLLDSWCKTPVENALRKMKRFLQHQRPSSHTKRARLCGCLSVPVLQCPQGQAVKSSNPHWISF